MNLGDLIAELMRDPEFSRLYAKESRRIQRWDRIVNLLTFWRRRGGGSVIFAVDLKRHYDGEDGLVGPFYSRADAEEYVGAISDRFVREYAAVRPITPLGGEA